MKHLRNPENIAVALGLAQALGFAWASVVAEGGANIVAFVLALFRGALLGFALAFGLVMTAHAVPRIDQRKTRQVWLGWFALAGLLIVSPVIIAPAIQYSIPPDVLSVPWARWAWAASIAAAPDLVAIGIAITGKVGASSEPQQKTSETSDAKPAPSEPKKTQAAKTAKPERVPCPHEGAGCDRVFAVSDYDSKKAAQNAANAHARKCAYKPTVIDVGVKP
jgi:MFS family permease